MLAVAGYARACFRACRPTAFSHGVAIVLATASSIAYARGRSGGGFGDAFRQTFVEEPRETLRSLAGEEVGWRPLLDGAESAIDWLFETRAATMIYIGFPVGIDLAFGSLGSLALAARRRLRGGVRA